MLNIFYLSGTSIQPNFKVPKNLPYKRDIQCFSSKT